MGIDYNIIYNTVKYFEDEPEKEESIHNLVEKMSFF